MKDYKGHPINLNNGYYDVYMPKHHLARKNGSVMIHILIAEEMLGRELTEGEVVHHKDFNRLNNNFDNLMVFHSQSDHALYHSIIEKKFKGDFVFYKFNGVYHCYQLLISPENNTIKIKSEKNFLCPKCGSIISSGAKLCLKCSQLKARKVTWPSRETLKREIRQKNFVEIGKEYNVSDNAVRKWCKIYGLPFKSSEIKKYSSKEWKKI